MGRAVVSLLLILVSGYVWGSTVTMPCVMAQDLCLIKGGFNNLNDLWLALDTGSSFSVVDTSLTSSLVAVQGGTEFAGGAGKGETNNAIVYKDVQIRVGPILINSQKILSLPIQYTAQGVQHQVDGFLGWNLFNNFVVTIDYPKAAVSLSSFNDAKQLEVGEAIPFKIGSDNIPLISAAIKLKNGKVIRGKFLIDIGQLHMDVVIAEPFRISHPELLKEAPINHKSVTAVGGRIEFDISQVTEFKVGSQKVSPASVAYPIAPSGVYARSDIAGAIGVSLLKQFQVTFDYKRKKMFLLSR